eukprot:36826-Rhodomonas_salina.2
MKRYHELLACVCARKKISVFLSLFSSCNTENNAAHSCSQTSINMNNVTSKLPDVESFDSTIARLLLNYEGGALGVGLGAQANDTTNRRLHIYFHNGGVIPMMFRALGGDKKLVEEKILGSVWRAVGTVTDAFYHAEYSYCFLSFRTHDEAKIALDKLNDDKTVREAIRALIDSQTDSCAKKFVEQSTAMLFKNTRGESTLIRASWATPRPGRHRCDTYGRDFHDYDDDCPDGFDRDEWNNYCEGRD